MEMVLFSLCAGRETIVTPVRFLATVAERDETSVPRTILYTGKGGVGKTSVAAASARRAAASGLRTVVLSTDPDLEVGTPVKMGEQLTLSPRAVAVLRES